MPESFDPSIIGEFRDDAPVLETIGWNLETGAPRFDRGFNASRIASLACWRAARVPGASRIALSRTNSWVGGRSSYRRLVPIPDLHPTRLWVAVRRSPFLPSFGAS